MPNAAPPDVAKLRMGIALRAVFQSEAWLGAHAGLFTQLGIDLSFPAIATGGPASMAGALRGDWDVCHTGALPIVQGVLGRANCLRRRFVRYFLVRHFDFAD